MPSSTTSTTSCCPSCDPHDDLRRTGVLLHVRERLGDDVVGGRLDRLGVTPPGQGSELDRNRCAEHESLERRREALLGEKGRVQPARELADVLEPGGEFVDRAVEQRVALVRRLAQATEVEQHRQPLLRAVVKIALDSAALGVGDLDEPGTRGAQLLLRALAVGDVSEVSGERRRPGSPIP